MMPNFMVKHFKPVSIIFLLFPVLICSSAPVSNRENPHSKEFYTVPDSQMVWGEPTNLQLKNPFDIVSAMLKAGIRSSNQEITLAGEPLKPVGRTLVYLKNVYGRPVWTIPHGTMTPSEYLSCIFLPPVNERMGVTMVDTKGVPVRKTTNGLNLTPPALEGKKWNHWERDQRECISLLSHEDAEVYPLDPTKYFALEKPGLYKLTLIQHIYIIDTNNLLKAVDLPPVTIDVKVEDK
jgi:hypothetical protein